MTTNSIDRPESPTDCCPPPGADLTARVGDLEDRLDEALKVWARVVFMLDPGLDVLALSMPPTNADPPANPPADPPADDVVAEIDGLVLRLRAVMSRHRLRAARAEAERDELRARVADYERAIAWDTTCLGCASRMDALEAETARAEDAERERGEARRLLAAIRAKLDDMEQPGASFFDPYAAYALKRMCGWVGPPEGVELVEQAHLAHQSLRQQFDEARTDRDDLLMAVTRVRALHSPKAGWERQWKDPEEALREGWPPCAGCHLEGIGYRTIRTCPTLAILNASGTGREPHPAEASRTATDA